MSTLSRCSVPMYRNPSFTPGLAPPAAHLFNLHYSAHAVERIVNYTAAHGTPTGAPCLETEDEASATEAFVGSLWAVPYSSSAWGEPDEQPTGEFDTAALVAAWEPDAPDASPYLAFPGIASLAERLGIKPIAGGSPEFEPTAEDLAEYGAWSDELERRRAWDSRLADYLDARWAADRPDGPTRPAA